MVQTKTTTELFNELKDQYSKVFITPAYHAEEAYRDAIEFRETCKALLSQAVGIVEYLTAAYDNELPF